MLEAGWYCDVSIRSPDRSQGRLLTVPSTTYTVAFQSAPLTEARGDDTAPELPPPDRGVSIRSPDRSQGRYQETYRWRSQMLFQSAPLTEARGDHRQRYTSSDRQTFQSAPLTEARGDKYSPATAASGSAFQSAPLTEARGDQDRCYHRRPTCSVSIRSPDRSQGRSGSLLSPETDLLCFNPLP